MRKYCNLYARILIYVVVLGVMCGISFSILTPKFFHWWNTTTTYTGFYEIEKNSVDVLLFGSSHTACSFIPQKLYEKYGITSYNLGCEQQSLLVSYYWLKESLKCQKPKIVVLDGYMLFTYNENEALNSSEAGTRQALDYMKWSMVKVQAVRDIAINDPKQSAESYYLPNIRYHTRWCDLNGEDFFFLTNRMESETRGFVPLDGVHFEEEYEVIVPKEISSEVEKESFVPLMEEYLDKICMLCEKEGICLLLVKTPAVMQTPERYLALNAYAEEHGIPYLDYNEADVYRDCGYDMKSDSFDGEHSNVSGAEKLTDYLGRYLSEKYLQ